MIEELKQESDFIFHVALPTAVCCATSEAVAAIRVETNPFAAVCTAERDGLVGMMMDVMDMGDGCGVGV